MESENVFFAHHMPWNKGKLTAQKTPLKLREIWAIRTRLQMASNVRELAMFNRAIDGKLRACDLTRLQVHDFRHGAHVASTATVMQQKTQRQGRQAAVRSVNTLMTATYWQIGRRIVESEQAGENRAAYGRGLLQRLAADLTKRFGRGFGVDNLELMRLLFQNYPPAVISESVIRKPAVPTPTKKSESSTRVFSLPQLADAFPLSWTHYVHLLWRTRSPEERRFYESEALRGGWSVRQLGRQIGSQFYTRTLMSKDKRATIRSRPKKRSRIRTFSNSST